MEESSDLISAKSTSTKLRIASDKVMSRSRLTFSQTVQTAFMLNAMAVLFVLLWKFNPLKDVCEELKGGNHSSLRHDVGFRRNSTLQSLEKQLLENERLHEMLSSLLYKVERRKLPESSLSSNDDGYGRAGEVEGEKRKMEEQPLDLESILHLAKQAVEHVETLASSSFPSSISLTSSPLLTPSLLSIINQTASLTRNWAQMAFEDSCIPCSEQCSSFSSASSSRRALLSSLPSKRSKWPMCEKVSFHRMRGSLPLADSSASSSALRIDEKSLCTCAGDKPVKRIWDRNQMKPLCRDGSYAGRWVTYTEWEPYNCQYRKMSVRDMKLCLRGKWIHFVGDESTKLLANFFSRVVRVKRLDWVQEAVKSVAEEIETGTLQEVSSTAAITADADEKPKKENSVLAGNAGEGGGEGGESEENSEGRRFLKFDEVDERKKNSERNAAGDFEISEGRRKSLSEGFQNSQIPQNEKASSQQRLFSAVDSQVETDMPVISYSFRAKMAHQRFPQEGETEEDDVNNRMFFSLRERRERGMRMPDYLVMSIGAHEVIGWSGRPRVKLDFETFKDDVEELLSIVQKTVDMQNVIWYKALYVHPGKVQDERFFEVRSHHALYQDFAFRRFKKLGAMTMNFFQTTKTRPEACAGDGVHYDSEIMNQHALILSNVLCNSQKEEAAGRRSRSMIKRRGAGGGRHQLL